MDGLWIAWERQRRTTELAADLRIELRQWTSRVPYLLRVAWLALRTTALLAVRRPRLLIVQNPSVVLAALAAWLKPLLGYGLVVDRHSNFKLETVGFRSPRYRIFHALSRYSVPRADLTVVTNEHLRRLVQGMGGRALVLPDKIPDLPMAARAGGGDGESVVFVASHSSDEPIAEFVAAVRMLGPDVRVYVTGDTGRLDRAVMESAPSNLRFTGFLPEREFQELLGSCAVVVALTTAPHTLLCGAYEAVAAGKPLVLSAQEDLLDYFSRGVVPTGNDARSMAVAIRKALTEKTRLRGEIMALKAELNHSWAQRMDNLRSELAMLTGMDHS